MAERRLDLMETNIDDVDFTEDNEDTRVRKVGPLWCENTALFVLAKVAFFHLIFA